ncbi:hypothetical protein [Gordonia sp. SL306]|uniref:hypothetical protein n=1 Tax=Gordonia sp. SL306 TaxID=2995145 RepID=UPI0022718C3F|nr:hypothetical protein [Gordonia sp. SL306]WAC56835.1 hypothetical protein OVA31_06190 [Gordonia sp. SL306]
MANEPDAPDSRPISVSELLARSREEGGAATGGAREGRGRRRVGREGSVSVSELTGEIPRVRSADPPDAGPTEPETGGNRRSAPETPTPEERRDDASAFPRSANPVARRYADDRPVADRAPSPFPSQKPGPDGPPPSNRPSGPTASGMPGYASPSTRDFSASSVTGRLAPQTGANRPGPAPRGRPSAADSENANAVTGIIPVVEDDDDLVVVEPDDIDGYDLASPSGTPEAVEEQSEPADDFEAYRAFADIDEEPEPPKRRFGWLKNKQNADRSSRPAAARAREQVVADEPDVDEPDQVADTDREPDLDDLSVGGTAAFAAPTVAESSDPAEARTEYIGDLADGPDFDTAHIDTAHFDAEPTDVVHTETDSAETDGPAPDDLSTRAGRRRAAAIETARAEALDPVATTSDRDVAPAATPAIADDEHTDDKRDTDGSKHSPTVAWLVVIGQSIAGLAIGIGLFWGFTELWKWNVYFALVLAVLVIFGIVTFAHLVRRTKDLTTTLLALGVGLIVTIGPLVLLAT